MVGRALAIDRIRHDGTARIFWTVVSQSAVGGGRLKLEALFFNEMGQAANTRD